MHLGVMITYMYEVQQQCGSWSEVFTVAIDCTDRSLEQQHILCMLRLHQKNHGNRVNVLAAWWSGA